MTNNNVLALSKEVGKAAKTVAFQWPGIVEADDLEQMLYLHLLERPGTIDKLTIDFDDKQRLNAMIQLGHQIASKERADYDVFSGNFRYSVDEVKRLLEERALHHESPELGSNWSISEDFIQGGEFEDKVVAKLASETDLRRGMERLQAVNSKYAEIIRHKYLDNAVISESKDRDLLKRALPALTTQMNRSFKQQHAEHTDGPGTRRAVTRASAYNKSRSDYEGDDHWDGILG